MWKNLSPMLVAAVLLAFAVLVAPAPVRAQDPITVADTSVVSDFPKAMTFRFGATSASDINDIRLMYTVDRMNFAKVVSESWPRFTPGKSVNTQWVWDMRKSSLPPSASVEYWWTATGPAGKVESLKKKVLFEDGRYPWKNVRGGLVTLNWYRGDEAFAQALVTAAQNGMERLFKDTGARLDNPVKVFVYATSEDLQGAMIFAREWTGGAAYPEFGVIVLGIAPGILDWGKKAMVHELAHFVVNHLTFSPYAGTLPTWLNEGIAMYAEGEPDQYQEAFLNKAIREGKLISLRSLSSPFSAVPEQAIISYAESFRVVTYLITTYGREKMLNLLTMFKEGATPDEALQKVYGFDQDGLYSQWLASVGAKPK